MTDTEKLEVLVVAAQNTLARIRQRMVDIDGLGDELELALLTIGKYPFTPESLVLITPRQNLIDWANYDDRLFQDLCAEASESLWILSDERDFSRGL